MKNSPNSQVLFEELPGKNGKIGIATLNRPEALNALSPEMVTALNERLRAWNIDPNISAVIIKSSSEKAFCAGGDIKQVYEMGAAQYVKEIPFFSEEYKLDNVIGEYSKPYISLLNGISMGGGLGLSINGNRVIASDDLKLAMPETGIGFFPDTGATYFLSHCKDNLGMYLGLTGRIIDVADSIYCCLVHAYVPKEDFAKLIQDIANNPISELDNIITTYSKTPNEPALKDHADIIRNCFGKNSVEEIIDALYEEGSKWSIETVKHLQTRSPTSLKITHKAFTLGKNMTLPECIHMEFNLTLEVVPRHDFREGVRAVIVDKTHDPIWDPATLAEISPQQIDDMFVMKWEL